MGVKSRTLIIDDDVKTAEKLTEMLSDYPDIRVIGHAATFGEGEKLVMELKPDVLFLDIELPDGDGRDMLHKIEAAHLDTYIIMFTGFYKDYSKEAFAGNEADYLLKPIETLELDKAVQRYRRSLAGKHSQIVKTNTEPPLGEVFTATTYTNDMRIMRAAEIGYFRYSRMRRVWEGALSDHTFVQLKRGTSASDILAYSPHFVQTHQSYIVNMNYLTLIGTTRCTLYPPFNEDEVLVGRRFCNDLKNRFTLI